MDALEHFRQEKDEFFRLDPQSPLTPEQQRSFTGLRYFPANPALDLVITLDIFPEQKALEMQTTTGDVRTYLRLGRFAFEVDGQAASLTIYSADYGAFLPFVDSLAGVETYGAGRYLEPEDLGGGRFHVDFNLAYNPYCAYNARWSCPITPAENRIAVPVRAGERLFDAHDVAGSASGPTP
jgi:uncharacterized protein (DUF1684 family)